MLLEYTRMRSSPRRIFLSIPHFLSLQEASVQFCLLFPFFHVYQILQKEIDRHVQCLYDREYYSRCHCRHRYSRLTRGGVHGALPFRGPDIRNAECFICFGCTYAQSFPRKEDDVVLPLRVCVAGEKVIRLRLRTMPRFQKERRRSKGRLFLAQLSWAIQLCSLSFVVRQAHYDIAKTMTKVVVYHEQDSRAARIESNGGEGGIRTLETLSGLHAFQACALGHYATSPCGAA